MMNALLNRVIEVNSIPAISTKLTKPTLLSWFFHLISSNSSILDGNVGSCNIPCTG